MPEGGESLALLGRWQRGEITDQLLFDAIEVLAAGQGKLQECAIARELDRQVEEKLSR